MKIDNEYGGARTANDNVSSSSSTTSSSIATTNNNTSSNISVANYQLVSSANTTTTTSAGGVDCASLPSSSTSPALTGDPASNNSSSAAAAPSEAANNEHQLQQLQQQQQQQHFLEQLVQHQINSQKLATLGRPHMFDHHHSHPHSHLLSHHHGAGHPLLQNYQNGGGEPSPLVQHKYATNRFGTVGGGSVNPYDGQPHPPSVPPPSMAQATTAYLVQTATGSALLIPPPQQQSATATNNTTFSMSRNPYGITTIPLQQHVVAAASAQPSSTGADFGRPDSTSSTNVYQTIDAEKTGYLYPLENFYETSSAYHNGTMTASKGGNKYKRAYQQQLQQQQQTQHLLAQQYQQLQHAAVVQQQHSQLSKLIENHNSSSSNQSGSTLHSATNNTASNFFASPALSAASNRRLAKGSAFERARYRLGKKLGAYGSWKCVAVLALCMAAALLALAVHLGLMRAYNLTWQLKPASAQTSSAAAAARMDGVGHLDRKFTSPVLFTKLGDTVEDQLPAYEAFNVQFYMDSSAYVKFNLSVNRNANLGVYAERNAAPTFTRFKFFEPISGASLLVAPPKNGQKAPAKSKSARAPGQSLGPMVNTGFVHFLEEGLWYVSVFNDHKAPLRFRLRTEYHEYVNSNCPANCFGKGECVRGKCVCFPGFSGADCSSNTCPVLCSAHGKYEAGKCVCESGWHGVECELAADQCELPDCSGNGECKAGKCVCSPGFEGRSCEKATCPAPDCSGHGLCRDGQCICFHNYTGPDCAQTVVAVASAATALCSGRGDFDYARRECVCSRGWLGPDCAQHENCLDRACKQCRNGWSGPGCGTRAPLSCDARCNAHGICLNGTCTCSPGFQGRNCDINTCPNGCSGNGLCERVAGHQSSRYACVCNPGWTGKACETAVELVCNDDIDNDRDGLVDCMDSECCGYDNCKLSLACSTSPEPKDRLLRKQPPSLSATFFDKMRFLIEDGSVQAFANSNSFTESQVSVIRGQVLFKNGQPLVGVKVAVVASPAYGYTLTRSNGIFDLMVNGGGSVTLEFSRSRLRTRQVAVNAAWNQFVHVDPVVLQLADDPDSLTQPEPCRALMHNASAVFPVVRTGWRETRTSISSAGVLAADSGVVRAELGLADSGLKLVYSSSQAPGFHSSVFVLLTQRDIPESLQQVHLQIVVEGVVHKSSFDAYADLSYEFAWDRRNAYEQRVYGFTHAKVSVGYQYEECAYVYWQSVQVRLAGYDLGSSEIGSWNLDVHHRLNTQQGILHKGDGTTVYLREMQKLVETPAGQLKARRDLQCSDCPMAGQEPVKFYAPSALSINKDGVIFIADYNFIWMLNNTEPPRRILELKMDQPHKYYLANDPSLGNLYATDSVQRLLLTVKSLDQPGDLKSNVRIATEFCRASRPAADCQLDDSLARHLAYPKGFAFDSNGIVYFVDGSVVRMVAADGVVRTLVGGPGGAATPYRPMGCNTSYALADVRFYWPTSLAVSPLDNAIHVLDEGVVYRLTEFGTVEVVAGVPFGCEGHFLRLHSPVDMAFSPEGDLYVLENDQARNVKQVRVLRSSGEVEVFYGAGGQSELYRFDFEATARGFNDPVAIAVHPNRSVYVLDRGDNVLYHIRSSIARDDYTGKYTIVSPETREAYIFNRFGLHMHTMDLDSGSMLFNFSYNGNALYGKLTSVADQSAQVLAIKRDFHGRAESLQTASGASMRLKLNNFDMLRSLTTSLDNKNYGFSYLGNTGLLVARTEPGEKSTSFGYERSGKVREIVEANNVVTNVSYFINASGIVTAMSRAIDHYTETWINNGSQISVYKRNKLDSTLELANLNVRSIANEDIFNSYKLYFKSAYGGGTLRGEVAASSAAKASAQKNPAKRKKFS